MPDDGKTPRYPKEGGPEDMQSLQQLAWARLRHMLEGEKLSVADLLRVIAADAPAAPLSGDLVLYVRSEEPDA